MGGAMILLACLFSTACALCPCIDVSEKLAGSPMFDKDAHGGRGGLICTGKCAAVHDIHPGSPAPHPAAFQIVLTSPNKFVNLWTTIAAAQQSTR